MLKKCGMVVVSAFYFNCGGLFIVRRAGIQDLLNWFMTYYCTKRYPNDPAVKQTRLLEAAKRTGSMINCLSGLAVMNVHHFFHSGREQSGNGLPDYRSLFHDPEGVVIPMRSTM